MRKFTNEMREPIQLGGIHEVVDEANDGAKAIPIVFVNKSGNNESFTYDNVIEPGTAVRNRMTSPVSRDSRGNSRVVDEDVDGQKAVPFVVVTKDENGRFVYDDFGKGGGGSGISVYNTLSELETAFPRGSSTPAFVTSEKAWYYWRNITEQTVAFINAIFGQTNSAGWKSTLIYMTKTMTLSKVHTKQKTAAAIPFEVWQADANEKLINKVAEGTTVSAFDPSGFLVGTLPTPITMNKGTTYLIAFNHPANVDVRYTSSPTQRNENDYWKYIGKRTYTPAVNYIGSSGDLGAYEVKLTVTEVV